MGRNNTRKRYNTSNDNRTSADFGVSDALRSVKRRRLSDDTQEGELGSQNGNKSLHSDGWQTVPSRSSKHQQRQQKKDYPRLSFGHKITKPIRIEQLRDLALYVLADGVAPEWVAVSNARSISKVVVVMVPGLDAAALERGKVLLNELHKSSTQVQSQPVEQLPTSKTDVMISHDNFDNDEGENSSVANVHANTTTSTGEIDKFSDLLRSDIDKWLVQETLPVMAPGDGKFGKVHSPLQAILMTPESSGRSTAKQPTENKFKPIITPITDFIHSSDELREAEYPIHPATFASAADAALESSRRERTGQSKNAGWVDSEITELGPVIPSTSPANPPDTTSQGLTIYAIDCEMVLTSDQQSSLARISVVSWPSGKVVMDKYVKPDLPIENYFTQYSGITPEILENVTTKLADIQQELLSVLTPSTVLLGHSLESDLNALRLTHPFIVDTSMLYPHPRGLPLRSSLKFLANKYLKREIQMAGANGHDSVEDARAVLDLVKLKCEKGPKFGTPEVNGEPIFKRLSRHMKRDRKPITTAIVEYGSSPERGLGKDATFAIGCQNDVEILAGILRAIKGDADGSDIPAGGVDFTWSRLRMMEFARGWVTSNNASANTISNNSLSTEVNISKSTKTDTDSDENHSAQAEIDKAILTTLQHVAQIRGALPPTTLLMLFNGTSDVRPLLKLQAQQSQYRKEFKVKKWDELTVKWTDTEEQALRNAAEKARLGWGWIGIT